MGCTATTAWWRLYGYLDDSYLGTDSAKSNYLPGFGQAWATSLVCLPSPALASDAAAMAVDS